MAKITVELLDREQLLSIRRKSDELFVSGIYFIWSEDVIVYVGQSLNVLRRAMEHMGGANSRVRGATHFSYVETPDHALNLMEALYIDKFKPIYNASPGNFSWKADVVESVESQGGET